MLRLTAFGFVMAFVGLVGPAYGEEAPGVTGTWKWESTGRGGQTRESTLKLKLDGDKLTGALLGRDDQEFPIKDATFKEGVVTFKVTRKFNDQERTQSYSGKLDGDTIKGKIKFERQGEEVERDWEAKREKEEKE